MKTFVLASKNKHKAEEIRQILGEEFEILAYIRRGMPGRMQRMKTIFKNYWKHLKMCRPWREERLSSV